jgi:hypothetical protein
MEAVNPPVFSHCHSVTLTAPAGGGEVKKSNPVIRVSIAAIPTEPAPINAFQRPGIFPPKMERTRKPSKGSIGINARRIAIFYELVSFRSLS